MSARDKDTLILSIPPDQKNSIAAPKNTSSFQNNNRSVPKNDQINGSSNAPHYDLSENNTSSSSNTASSSQNTTNLTPLEQQNNRTRNILSSRQPHQPVDPTPLRQHMTNDSLRHTSEPIMSSTASSFMHNHKTTPLASQNPQPTSSSTTTAEDPKHQPSNNPTTHSSHPSKDPKTQNPNNNPRSIIKPYTLGPRNHTFPPRRLEAPWIDPRYDPDLTFAERLEASTDLPLALFSDYEWKVKDEYVRLTSWQPRDRRDRGWKGMGE